MIPQAGVILDQTYKLEKALFRDNAAMAWLAREQAEGKTYLLFTLLPELSQNEQIRAKFHKLDTTLRQLTHPNLQRYLGYHISDETLYYLTQLPLGATLRQTILRKGKPFTPQQAHAVLQPICAALGYAHYLNLVHRNIQAEFIYIQSNGMVSLNAFGHPTIIGEGYQPNVPFYAAPETFPHNTLPLPNDLRADLFSLAVIIYEMLTGGAYPYQGDKTEIESEDIFERVYDEMLYYTPEPPSAFNPTVNPEIDRIVLRALNPDPGNRYPSAMELLSAYRDAMMHPPKKFVTPAVPLKPKPEPKPAASEAATKPARRIILPAQPDKAEPVEAPAQPEMPEPEGSSAQVAPPVEEEATSKPLPLETSAHEDLPTEPLPEAKPAKPVYATPPRSVSAPPPAMGEISPQESSEETSDQPAVPVFVRIEYANTLYIGEAAPIRISLLRQRHTGDLMAEVQIAWVHLRVPASNIAPELEFKLQSPHLQITPAEQKSQLTLGEDVHLNFRVVPYKSPHSAQALTNINLDIYYEGKPLAHQSLRVKIMKPPVILL